MFEKGQRVRVRADVAAVSGETVAGHVGTITADEPQVDESIPEGAMAYLVLFDQPEDKGWVNWMSDVWLNDYEIEAADGTD